MIEPVPSGPETACLAMGCLWGGERKFFELDGVAKTSVGYLNSFTPIPTYQEACTGKSARAETLKFAFDPTHQFRRVSQSNSGLPLRRGSGSQYRSTIHFVSDEQAAIARMVTDQYAATLNDVGFGPITSEIALAVPFHMTEERH